MHQLDHLLAKLRWVRSSRSRHGGLLECKRSGVHKTGSTPEEFSVGDTVQLKSGGPDMTVAEIRSEEVGGIRRVQCMWFNDVTKKFELSIFRVELLFKVPIDKS
jgi:uncharacterized protein YodC (DUF2158 family)